MTPEDVPTTKEEQDVLERLIPPSDYERGYLDGLAAYAYSSSEPWAENGVQYVGTTGTTLREAKARARETWNFSEPHHGA